MIRTQKILLIVFAVVFIGWIVVLIGNIVTSGWEIIGIHDIWPMILCAVMMIVFMRAKLKPPSGENVVTEPKQDDEQDEGPQADE